jgi:hypothetical protein
MFEFLSVIDVLSLEPYICDFNKGLVHFREGRGISFPTAFIGKFRYCP